MKKSRLIAVLSMALATGLIIIGTLSYFKVETAFKNVFKVTQTEADSKIIVDLAEPNWEKTGKAMAQKIMPNMTIPKDPTITIQAPSDPVYARYAIAVTDTDGKICAEKAVVDSILALTDVKDTKAVLKIENVEEVDGITCYKDGIVYYNVQSIFDSEATEGSSKETEGRINVHKLFTQLHIPAKWTGEEIAQYGKFDIKIIVQSILYVPGEEVNVFLENLDVPKFE